MGGAILCNVCRRQWIVAASCCTAVDGSLATTKYYLVGCLPSIMLWDLRLPGKFWYGSVARSTIVIPFKVNGEGACEHASAAQRVNKSVRDRF